MHQNGDFITNGIKLIEYYLNRGYPLHALKKHMLKAAKFTQDECVKQSDSETKNKDKHTCHSHQV